MKFYVAGIRITDDHYYNSTTLENTNRIIDLLDHIQHDASHALGDNATVIVILEEYALTPSAIPADQRREALMKLQQAVKKFKNTIIIPGSLSSYEIFTDTTRQQNKLNKLQLNHQTIANSSALTNVSAGYDKQIVNAMSNSDSSNCLLLQNTAYILTAMGKYQHKKSTPYFEARKLPFIFTPNVYYIGSDDFIKHVMLNGNSIDTGLFICLEHARANHVAITTREAPPLLHAIVSASIDLYTHKLIGALNIQMDSAIGLTVVKNNKHFRSAEIEDVIAVTYLTSSPHVHDHIKVDTIEKPLEPRPRTPNLPRKAATPPTLIPVLPRLNRLPNKRDREENPDDNESTNRKRTKPKHHNR